MHCKIILLCNCLSSQSSVHYCIWYGDRLSRCQPGYSLEALESYMQECGRAGRNGQASSAVICVNKSDLSIKHA